MARYAKRLAQTALSATTTAIYTAPALTTAQVTEIFITNTGTTQRTVNITTGGTFSTNSIIIGLAVNGTASVILEDKKIVIAPSQILGAFQNSGTDVVMTVFGVEEV